MTLQFYLHEGEKGISNLTFADAIIRVCDENYHDDLDAETIAKLVILQVEGMKGGAE